jgi:hypothetical protein
MTDSRSFIIPPADCPHSILPRLQGLHTSGAEVFCVFFSPVGDVIHFYKSAYFSSSILQATAASAKYNDPPSISATALSAAQLQLQRIPLASWTLKAVDLYHLTRKSLKQEGFKHTHKNVLQSTSSPYHHHCNRNPGMY